MAAPQNPKQQTRAVTLHQELVSRLSANARSVLALAQEYGKLQGVMHMEHVFFALVDLDITNTRKLLEKNQLTRSHLVAALAAARKFDIPRSPLKAGELRLPVVASRHVAEALGYADNFRRSNNRDTVRTRHVLVGLLAVEDCALVGQLATLNIRRKEAEIVAGLDEGEKGQTGDRFGTRVTNGRELGRPEVSSSAGPIPPLAATRETIAPNKAEDYRDLLIRGTDDERQEIVERIAGEVRTSDFAPLRQRLVADLQLNFPGYTEPISAEARSWLISALSCIADKDDMEVVTLLQQSLDPIKENSELVRFWSVLALRNVTGEVPVISTTDIGGPTGMLAEALQAQDTGQIPSSIQLALQGTTEDLRWYALRTLRIVAFPALIPQLCELLDRSANDPTSRVPFDVILALAHPEIIREAAQTLQRRLGTGITAGSAVTALRNSNLKRVREFARLLELLDREEVEKSLKDFAASSDARTAQAARVLMERLAIADEVSPVAGYLTDSIPDADQALKDEIGIDKDVKTLCSVLLAAEVKPPLAVGLFGDWGTGKSYFMEKMHREIEDLARRAGKAEKTAYLKRVVQIRFNAWHYADANLWASLVTHIFDELSKEVNKGESAEETKKRLMSQLESAKQALNDAVIEQKRAQSESNAAEVSLNRVRQEREQKQIELKQLRVPDLWEVLNAEDQKELKEELTTAIAELGLEPAIGSVKELNNVYQQAVTLAGHGRSAFLSLWRSKDRRVFIALVVLALVLVPVAGYLIHKMAHDAGLVGWIASLSEVPVFLGGFAPKIKKHLNAASRSLKELEEARDRALEVLSEKRKKVSDAERVKERELERLRGEEAAAAQRVSLADAKVLEVTQKLEEINSGRSLSKFLLERVQADDYRKHLGIISLIRKDFERLNDLLTKGEGGLEQIGRIILYIDDLDRCPADKVVDVLQATHLLLAMKLFVAVVGVDLRWLLHSLDQQYSAFRADENGNGKGLRPEWITSPQSYLEKIFQIPFNLKPMDSPGYGRLISSLFPRAQEKPAEESGKEGDGAPAEEAKAAGAQNGAEMPNAGGAQEAAAPEAASGKETGTESPRVNADAAKSAPDVPARDLDPAALIIKDWEREFAAKMFPFVPSPRAAKRFANIYRILKAPLTSYELRDFEGRRESPGEFQAAMLLLAVATGLPQQTAELFRAIVAEGEKARHDERTAPWREIFAEFIGEPEKKAVLEQLKLDERIEPFYKWAPRVGRFTFEAAKAAGVARGWQTRAHEMQPPAVPTSSAIPSSTPGSDLAN